MNRKKEKKRKKFQQIMETKLFTAHKISPKPGTIHLTNDCIDKKQAGRQKEVI